MRILTFLLVCFISKSVFTQEIDLGDINPLSGYIVKTDTINVMKQTPKGDGKIISFDLVCSFFINYVDKEIYIYVNGVFVDHYRIKTEIRKGKQMIYYNSNRKYKSTITLDYDGKTTSLLMVKRKRFHREKILIFSKNMYFDDYIIKNEIEADN